MQTAELLYICAHYRGIPEDVVPITAGIPQILNPIPQISAPILRLLCHSLISTLGTCELGIFVRSESNRRLRFESGCSRLRVLC